MEKMNLGELFTVQSVILLKIMHKMVEFLFRFAATKLIEGDELILEKMQLDENEKETLEHLILQMGKRKRS